MAKQKLKTNKSAAKRFKKTGSGGFKHRQSHRNHILTKKPNKRMRHLRHMKQIKPSDEATIRQMLAAVKS